jgi:hypothetical protein
MRPPGQQCNQESKSVVPKRGEPQRAGAKLPRLLWSEAGAVIRLLTQLL